MERLLFHLKGSFLIEKTGKKVKRKDGNFTEEKNCLSPLLPSLSFRYPNY